MKSICLVEIESGDYKEKQMGGENTRVLIQKVETSS